MAATCMTRDAVARIVTLCAAPALAASVALAQAEAAKSRLAIKILDGRFIGETALECR